MKKLLIDIGKKSKKAIDKRLSTKKKDEVLKDYRLLILKNKKLIFKILHFFWFHYHLFPKLKYLRLLLFVFP